MITFIRRLITSKIGVVVALVLLAMMALSFAVGDVANMNLGGGVNVGAGNVAKVGDETITINDLRRKLDAGLRQAQQQNPGLTMQQFIGAGGLERTIKELTDVAALEQYGRSLGINISSAAVDAVIARDPAFAGLTGQFDQKVFEQRITSEGMSAADVREQIATQAIVRQLLAPVGQIPAVPPGFTLPYASLLLEQRSGQAAFIPASRFVPTAAPTPAQLNSYFNAQRARYAIPERRVIRYALIDQSAVRTPPAVTPAEVQAEYRANAAAYAASETRRFAQVIAGTRAAADRIAAAARGSASLAEAARSAGLQAATVTGTSEAQFAGTTDATIARSAFAANQGAVIGPVQVPLGFMVLELLEVNRRPARSLADVTPELTASLTMRKRREALDDLYNAAQDAMNSGASVSEVAQDKGLQVVTTPALIANGTAPENPAWRPTPVMEPILRAAFQSSAGDPGQIIQAQGTDVFAIVEVADFIAAAPPPLARIRDRVVADWRQAEGSKAARARARQILAAVERGQSLSAAATAAGVGGAVQTIGGRRIGATSDQGRLPPEVALLFSMARGTAKTLELPGSSGWMVIRLDSTTRGDATGNTELLAAVEQQFGGALGAEYVEILVRAARREFEVTENSEVIAQLRRELTGAATPATN